MFFAGLDLGPKRDYLAIAIVERKPALARRYVERVPLGTSYSGVVERVRKMMEHPEMRGRCSLAVDDTGVGAPVVEMLRRARLGRELYAVAITGGDREHRSGATGVCPSAI